MAVWVVVFCAIMEHLVLAFGLIFFPRCVSGMVYPGWKGLRLEVKVGWVVIVTRNDTKRASGIGRNTKYIV